MAETFDVDQTSNHQRSTVIVPELGMLVHAAGALAPQIAAPMSGALLPFAEELAASQPVRHARGIVGRLGRVVLFPGSTGAPKDVRRMRSNLKYAVDAHERQALAFLPATSYVDLLPKNPRRARISRRRSNQTDVPCGDTSSRATAVSLSCSISRSTSSKGHPRIAASNDVRTGERAAVIRLT
jgi:hypothetical protein